MNTVMKSRFTSDEYLQWESEQTEKHEYYAGEVFAMAGARRAHVVVSGNIFAGFKQALRGRGCQAYIADTAIQNIIKTQRHEIRSFYFRHTHVSPV